MPQPTGISTYAFNLMPYLKALDPTLVVAKPFAGFTCYPVSPNLTADKGTQGHVRRLMWTQVQLPKIYHQLRSQLLFSPVPEAPLYTKCRQVVMCHDLIPLRFPRRFSPLVPYFKYYIPQVLRQAQHVICNSNATAQDLMKFYQIPSSRITPIPLAYNPDHFQVLNLPTQNYFLYLGRIVDYKNILRIIQAFAALPQYQNYQLWLSGPVEDHRYLPVLQRAVTELNLTNYVNFLGYLPYKDLPTLINQAIALVYPSLWEGFGIPVLEAMACGTPVITSNISSLPEVAGDAALLVNPYDVSAISQAMHSLATDDELWRSQRQAGLNRVTQFSWAKTGKMTAAVLQQFLA
jgi:glycosyltransferase involved in cell wall biosynthesis